MTQPLWKREAKAFHKAVLAERAGTEEDVLFCSLAIAGEAGELANLAKKLWRKRWGWDPGDLTEEMKKEAADIYIYLIHFSDAIGFDLDEAAEEKWNEVKQRKEFKFEERVGELESGNQLWQVICPAKSVKQLRFCAGIEVSQDGIIVNAAPILRFAVNHQFAWFKEYCKERGWRLEHGE